MGMWQRAMLHCEHVEMCVHAHGHKWIHSHMEFSTLVFDSSSSPIYKLEIAALQ